MTTVMRILRFWVVILVILPVYIQAEDKAESRRIRVGVDIRLGLQSCMDSWTPITEYLSKSISDCRFVIVPLASQQDLIRVLEKGEIDFMSLDPALELLAEDRFGASPLATMIELPPDDLQVRPADAACGGAIIVRANHPEIKTIGDLRGKRISAVKPWSLTGWIAQWALLKKNRIDPQKDLAQVAFEGTHWQVVKNVLNGKADAGMLDADLLSSMLANHRIPDKALSIINQQGTVIPLVMNQNVFATKIYPGRMLSKAASTSDALAKRVVDALMPQTLDIELDAMPYRIHWTVPANYSKVRQTLIGLMGVHFADSAGYPLPKQYPEWLPAALLIGCVCFLAAVILGIMRGRHHRRMRLVSEQLETTRRELAEVRADKQRIDTILTLAGCGIDIVDDDDQVIYADAGIVRKYGDWRGKRCYEYFCGSDAPCPCCTRPGPLDGLEKTIQNFDCSNWASVSDTHAKVHFTENESMQMIGIPFHDESGKWLYARIHMPTAALVEKSV